MILVSVIIPTFQRIDYLKHTLNSVISQTYPNIEIIVVDDGSPTNAVRDLCEDFPTVNYYRIDNSGGPATPRNFGFKKSKGQYIAFLDDDDIWVPEKIEIQVGLLKTKPDYGLVHNYCNVIDSVGNLTGEIVGRPGSLDVKHGDVKMKMIGNWTLMMPTPLVRRSLIDKIGLFNTKIPPALEDVEFWTRCSFYTKFYYLDEPLSQYRIHNHNISKHKSVYINLPLFLKKLLDNVLNDGLINKHEYKKLLQQVCRSQAKHIKNNKLKTLINLNSLNPFWIFNLGILKLILKRIL